MRRSASRVAALLLGLVGAASCSSAGGGAEVRAVGDEALAAVAVDAVREHGLPAFALARLAAGELAVSVAGTRSVDDDRGVGLEAPFHLGSDTKAMTAVVLASFVEDGVIGLDMSLEAAFPDRTVHATLRDASLREVLSHRAGLTDDRLDLQRLHQERDVVASRAAVTAESLASPVTSRGQFGYANTNYIVIGALIERLSKQPWEQTLTERLFDPLGMDCGFGAPDGEDAPLGHTPRGHSVGDDALVRDNPPALWPAGGVHCSVRSWAAFAGAVLDNLRGQDSPLMTAATAGDLFSGTGAYVAGWQRNGAGDDLTYGHDGSNTLWYARAVLQPAQNRAILLATNTGEANGLRAIDAVTSQLLRSQKGWRTQAGG